MRTSTRSVALAVAAAALLAPAAAGASDVALTFDNAVLDTPSTPDQVVVEPSGAPITATAVVDDATGDFTIDPAAFDFPKYTFSDPTPGEIDVILNAPATGKIDLATGQVTMNADFEAQITLQAFGNCNIDTGVLTLSTEASEPLPGRRFPPGVAGFASGPGAVAVSWATLPPGMGPGCQLIDSFVQGPGGFWISDGVDPFPAAPPNTRAKLKVMVKPGARTVGPGQKAKFEVTVRNPGNTPARDVEVCAKIVGRDGTVCDPLAALGAGKSKRRTYAFRLPGRKRGYKLAVSATGDGVKSGKATANLTVKKKR